MSIEKTTFQFAEKVRDVGDLTHLETLFIDHMAPLGGEIVFVGAMILPGGVTKPQALFGTLDCDWFLHYSAERLFLEDPAVRHAKMRNDAFTWSEVVAWGDLTPGEQRVMAEPAKYGLREGLVVPIRRPDGSLFTVTVAGPRFKVDRTVKTAITLMAKCAIERLTELTPGNDWSGTGIATLSPRQRECLNWVQHGKSDREIAAILHISPHTVKEHIDAANKALGVATRVEAVVHARQANLIGIVPLSTHRARARQAKT